MLKKTVHSAQWLQRPKQFPPIRRVIFFRVAIGLTATVAALVLLTAMLEHRRAVNEVTQTQSRQVAAAATLLDEQLGNIVRQADSLNRFAPEDFVVSVNVVRLYARRVLQTNDAVYRVAWRDDKGSSAVSKFDGNLFTNAGATDSKLDQPPCEPGAFSQAEFTRLDEPLIWYCAKMRDAASEARFFVQFSPPVESSRWGRLFGAATGMVVDANGNVISHSNRDYARRRLNVQSTLFKDPAFALSDGAGSATKTSSGVSLVEPSSQVIRTITRSAVASWYVVV